MPAVMKQANAASIKDAADILKSGGLVAIPTETVYGLGANALDGVAVAKIFSAKGRPQFNPLIIHLPDLERVAEYCVVDHRTRQVAEKFWPGPLTLILPRMEDCAISDLCSAGLPTLAVRVPGHKVAQDLLRVCGLPIAAPSANPSGSISPTTPIHVMEGLGQEIDFILADGACSVGLESTVLDLSNDHPVIIRPGAITAEDVQAVLGVDVSYDLGDKGDDVKSPGQLLKHYAPGLPMRLNAVDVRPGEGLLAFGSLKFMGMTGGGFAKDLPEAHLQNLSAEGDLYEAAANLFRMMRMLDHADNNGIAVMSIPDQGIGLAINDRLKRAAAQ